MKKLYFISCIFILFFSSCETEFDVHAEWEEVLVVYGLIDPAEEAQYVRINKAYLGDGDAIQMASTDSINIDPSDFRVVIKKEKLNSFNDWEILDSLPLIDTVMYKEEGLFYSAQNIIYYVENNSFFDVSNYDDRRFSIYVTNKRTDVSVDSYTKLVQPIQFDLNQSYQLGLYNANEFQLGDIKWIKPKNAYVYELELVLKYTELYNGSLDTISIGWKSSVVDKNKITVDGEKYFNFLENEIQKNSLVQRNYIGFEAIITAGSEDLYTYISINTPSSSIVQERPAFTNINNGIGIFSSRTSEKSSITLTSQTIDYLKSEGFGRFQ